MRGLKGHWVHTGAMSLPDGGGVRASCSMFETGIGEMTLHKQDLRTTWNDAKLYNIERSTVN